MWRWRASQERSLLWEIEKQARQRLADIRSKFPVSMSPLFGILILVTVCATDALSWPWSSYDSTMGSGAAGSVKGSASFESETKGTFVSHRSPIKDAQQMLSAGTASMGSSCWHSAYKKLLSSCREILRDEEKKGRLAYQLTDCFLTMTGWPSPKACPQNVLIRTCTEKFDQHTHSLYLAFFVDTAAMCHHLQSEAFKLETEQVVNDLKGSAHWIVEKLNDVEVQFGEILNSALEESQKLEGKLTGMQSISESVLHKAEGLDDRLKDEQDRSQLIYERYSEIMSMQLLGQKQHAEMDTVLNEGMKGLKKTAQETREHLHGVAELDQQISRRQKELAGALVDQIGRFKETALQSMDQLQHLYSSDMEETRSSVRGLAEQARKAHEDLKPWQSEVKRVHQLLENRYQTMLKTQEAFMSKQGAVLSTIDRLFSLYDSILYEARALKMLLVYGTALLFVQVLTSTKQMMDARVLLYAGLCVAMAVELWLIRVYGKVLENQRVIETRVYWTRIAFTAFLAMVFVYYFATYRDIAVWNHRLLLELHQRLSDTEEGDLHTLSSAHSTLTEAHVNSLIRVSPQCSLPPWKSRPVTAAQTMADRIIRRMHRFIRRRRRKQPTKHHGDALSLWMKSRGMDTRVFDHSDSSDEDDDPNFELSRKELVQVGGVSYNLRSQCHQSLGCNLQLRRQ